MKKTALDLYIVLGLTIIAVLVVTLLRFSSGIQLIAAFLMVFVLPGYSLTAALLPGRRPGVAEKILFSVGLSIGTTILTGVVLHFTPLGVQPVAWAITVGVITTIAGIIALLRRRDTSKVVSQGKIEFKLREIALLFGAMLLAGYAVYYSTSTQYTRAVEGYTALWMMPVENSISSVKVGLKSQELQAENYHLVISTSSDTVEVDIEISPGEEMSSEVQLPGVTYKGEQVTASLYRQTNPTELYRQVYLWLK